MKKLFLLGCLLMSVMLQTAFAMKIAGVKSLNRKRNERSGTLIEQLQYALVRGLCILLIGGKCRIGIGDKWIMCWRIGLYGRREIWINASIRGANR
jgi:hypothetical protein